MIGRKLHLAMASLMAASGSITPPEAQAFCCLFHRPAPVCAPAPAPCCPQTCNYAPQTCNYIPQTCYRTVIVNTPVTSCQPTVVTDPCTGCPHTTFRPVTSFVQQTRLVPYTSYRAVYASPCGGGCSSCGVSSYGCNSCGGGCSTCGVSPVMASYAPVAQPSCCGATPSYEPTYAAAPTYVAPAAPSCCGAPQGMPGAPVQALGAPQVGPPITAPGPGPEPDPANSAPSLPQTFQGSSSLTPVNPIRPSSDASSILKKDAEPASAPNTDDRTAARPTYRAWSYYGVTTQRTSAASDDSGWRSAH